MKKYSFDEIKEMVERSGATQFMLSNDGIRPAGIKSCNPEVKREFEDYVENEKVTFVTCRATQEEMSEFEKVEEWIPVMAQYCNICLRQPRVARAVLFTRMRNPKTGKRMLTDAKIARLKTMKCSRAIIPRWYNDGIRLLTKVANKEDLK